MSNELERLETMLQLNIEMHDTLATETEKLKHRVTNHEWDINELRAERRGREIPCHSTLDIALVFIIGAFFGASIIAGIDLYFWGLR